MTSEEIANAIRATVLRFAANIPLTAAFAGELIRRDLTVSEYLLPHVALNALRDLTGDAEESDAPEAEIEAMRNAYQAACELLGDPNPPEGDYRHEAVQLTRAMVDAAQHPERAHVAGIVEHMATLFDFHRDDDDDLQHADPIAHVERDADGQPDTLRIVTESRRSYLVTVAAEAAGAP